VDALLDATLQTLQTAWLQIVAFLPRAAAALLLLVGGWIVARLVRRLALRVLRLIKLDVLAEQAGVEDFLLQGGVRHTAVSLIANVVYWIALLVAFLAALNSLGVGTAADLLSRVVLYLPNVLVATLLLLVGSLVGRVARVAVFAYLTNVGVDGAAFISHAAQWAIIVFVVSIALEQLSIGGEILVSAFQIVFGAVCLALALAFGLGGRRLAAHLLDRVWKK